LKQFIKGAQYDSFERNQVWLGSFSREEIKRLLRTSYQVESDCIGNFFSPSEGVGDSFSRQQDIYFNYYLQNDILVKTDRTSMANSLEVRSPLLDLNLVRDVLTIPSRLKLNGFQTKHLFKHAMKDLLPSKIIHRSKKGFGIPVAKLIRGELRSAFEETLSPDRIQSDGIFNATEVTRLLEDHLQGRKDNRKALWTLYVFHRWKDQWLS